MFNKIGRQQQKAIGASGLRSLRKLLCHRGSVSAACDNRHTAIGLLDRSSDHRRKLLQRERKELARSTRGKQSRRLVLQQPLNMLAVRSFVEGVGIGEMSNGEREQTCSDLLGKLSGRHCGHMQRL